METAIWLSEDKGIDRKPIETDKLLDYERRALATPLQKFLIDQNKKLPETISHHLKDLAFDVVQFGIGIKTPSGYKWPKSVSIDYKLDSGGYFDIDDGLPGAEWADSNFSFEVETGITFKHAFKFLLARDLPPPKPAEPTVPPVNDPKTGIDTGLRLKFKWVPKIATIQSVHKGESGQWNYHAKPGQGVDGNLDLALMVRREPGNRSIVLHFREIRIVYQKDILFTDTALIENLTIPFHFASDV
jgi:hypothetical protein